MYPPLHWNPYADTGRWLTFGVVVGVDGAAHVMLQVLGLPAGA
ncbi:hypothetical protein [Micromonospora sp. WMMD737]